MDSIWVAKSINSWPPGQGEEWGVDSSKWSERGDELRRVEGSQDEYSKHL